jgi:hypothetical protein
METKYALLNPANGEYEYLSSEEEVKIKLAQRALDFYISHAHGIAYSIVTIDENGWETWDAKNNVSSFDQLQIEKEIQGLL